MTKLKDAPSYEEYSEWAQKQGIKTGDEFDKFKKTNKLPAGYHRDPYAFYKKQGTWKGWGDFLGTGNVRPVDRQILPTIEAKIEARKLAKKYDIRTR